ncbi:MAG: PilZ domain-containing protein [Candidatus Omnitrophica bacterium]|nr:PilZ domain-containing protein [Candidatus Omnitrophota bacterium]
MSEKRKFDRLAMQVQVHWKPVAYSTARQTDIARDISIGGLSLVLKEAPLAGELLDLDIELPGKKNIQAQAQVVRITEIRRYRQPQPVFKIGLSFTKIDPADVALIEKMVISSYFP